MNKDRRNALRKISESIEELCDQIDDIIVDEELAVSGIPDNLRGRAETALERLISSLSTAQESLMKAQVIIDGITTG